MVNKNPGNRLNDRELCATAGVALFLLAWGDAALGAFRALRRVKIPGRKGADFNNSGKENAKDPQPPNLGG